MAYAVTARIIRASKVRSSVMWRKSFSIAERQLLAGKLGKAEAHALKALECARTDNNEMQIAKTMFLLSEIYLDTDNARLEEVLLVSVEYAEKVYGADSPELADALATLSCWLSDRDEFARAQPLQDRALAIWIRRNLGNALTFFDEIVAINIKCNNFVEAKTYFLRALPLLKSRYGALSKEVQDQVPIYVEILLGLGETEEAAELAPCAHHCVTCGPDGRHVKYPADVDAVIKALTEKMSSRDVDRSIEALREALSELYALADKKTAGLREDDPFFDLKLRTIANPARWAKSSLAQLLRLKAEDESSSVHLREAAEIFRQILCESDNDSDRMHLMLTLVDLAAEDPSLYEELEEVLRTAPECAATLYTKALVLFRRFGSDAQSKSAMKQALKSNPYVPKLLASGVDGASVPNHFHYGEETEAAGYVLEAKHQWNSPGAAEFLLAVLGELMPRDYRRQLESAMQLAAV